MATETGGPPEPREFDRSLSSVDDLRQQARFTGEANAGSSEFASSQRFWEAQVGRVTDALVAGEVTKTEADGLLGSVIAKKETESEVDELTGIPNRRGLMKATERAWAHAERTGEPLSVVFVDLDRFKQVNDELGHDAGDKVLRTTAQVLKDSVRASDILGRYGGEEIVIVQPATTRLQAAQAVSRYAEALPTEVAAALEAEGAGIERRITMSAGIADRDSIDTDSSTPIADLMEKADKGVYAAKALGRDRVVSVLEPFRDGSNMLRDHKTGDLYKEEVSTGPDEEPIVVYRKIN